MPAGGDYASPHTSLFQGIEGTITYFEV